MPRWVSLQIEHPAELSRVYVTGRLGGAEGQGTGKCFRRLGLPPGASLIVHPSGRGRQSLAGIVEPDPVRPDSEELLDRRGVPERLLDLREVDGWQVAALPPLLRRVPLDPHVPGDAGQVDDLPAPLQLAQGFVRG